MEVEVEKAHTHTSIDFELPVLALNNIPFIKRNELGYTH